MAPTLGFEMAQYSPMNNGGNYVDVERQLRAAAAAGFDWYAIDVWSIAGYQQAGGDLDRFAELSRSLGLDCGQLQTLVLGAPQQPSVVPDLVNAAGPLQPATIQVIVVGEPQACLTPMRDAADQIREVASDVTFAIEVVPFAPMASIKEGLNFVRSSGVDGFGLNLDSWHFSQGPDDWSDIEALTAADITHLQFNDRGPNTTDNLMAELHRQRLPGTGEIDLDRFLGTVRRLGYSGRAGVEVISTELQAQPPEPVAVAEYTAARSYWRS
jgi:sugar phosphate isomerase/epimerase